MNQVEKLESKISTRTENENLRDVDDKDKPGFISGDLGVTAKVSFRLNSPWKAIGAWIRKLAA
jgi:hypothetical protein